MSYVFLYTKTTGEIYGAPYLGEVKEWENIPDGCGVIGPIPRGDTKAFEAFEHPNYYKIQNNRLTPVPNIDALRAADQAPKPPYIDPRDQKIATLETQMKEAFDTIDFLLLG